MDAANLRKASDLLGIESAAETIEIILKKLMKNRKQIELINSDAEDKSWQALAELEEADDK